MFEIRPTKGRGGIGGKRNPGAPIKNLKPMSDKQRKRTDVLHDKLEIYLKVQERIYGKRMCEATRGHENWKHKCPCTEGRFYPLVLDHVNTRQADDPDDFANLQGICTWANYVKGSVRGLDFRSPEMKAALVELDLKEKED